MHPELTVLLPVRDADPYLVPALHSLSAQTFEDWVCLVWDDGSRDGSRPILETHAKMDARFVIAGAPEPVGVARALQRLLARVETTWVARMDGDDLCTPSRFGIQIRTARARPKVALWGGGVLPLGDASTGWTRYLEWVNGITSEREIVRHAFTECVLPHPTWFARAGALRDAGGYRVGPFPEDYDLFLRLLRRGARFGKVSEVVLQWRDHPTRETRTSPRTHRDALLRLKARHFAETYGEGGLLDLPRRPLVIWGAGKTGRLLWNELRRQGQPIEGFVDPLKSGKTVSGLPVLAPDATPPGEHLLLVAVGPSHLREELRSRFEAEGRTFGRDYLWMF